jgi:chromosome segregation ATPase
MAGILGILVAIGVVGFFYFVWSPFTADAPKAEASTEELGKETKKVLQSLRKEEQNVFKVLDENLQKISQLKGQVSQVSNEPTKSLDEAVTQMEEVTKVFEDKAKHKEEVRREILQKVGKLYDLRNNAQNELAKLKERQNHLNLEKANIRDADPENVRIRTKGIEQRIEFVQHQVNIWNNFMGTYELMDKEINAVNQRVDRFLVIIDESALVYREALNLLTLQRDVRQAFALLNEDMPEMERLSTEMEQSWGNLDILVESMLSVAETPQPVQSGSQ